MFTGAFERLNLMLRGVLHIPPGVVYRQYGGGVNGASNNTAGGIDNLLATNDMVNTIVDITADDVCLGAEPLYIDGLDKLRVKSLQRQVEAINGAFNEIMHWVAVDLLKYGISAYTFQECVVDNGEEGVDGVRGARKEVVPKFVPYMAPLSIYMRNDGGIVVCDGTDGSDGAEIKDLLVFLNYSKESLVQLSGDDATIDAQHKAGILYGVTPEPVQLKNVRNVARDLYTTERAMYRYRTQLSRIIRFITVDVGNSSGEKTEEVVDAISSTINSESMSLAGSTGMDDVADNFNDALTVHPHRSGLGKPELEEHIPDFDIGKMADLDYTLGRLFMATRFPKTYIDFNTNLTDSTVSLIRGDIRYARMVDKVRSLIEKVVNEWLGYALNSVQLEVEERLPVFKLTALPSSEDDDIIDSLKSFSDFTNEFFGSINDSETVEEARARVGMLKTLIGDTSNLHAVQMWFNMLDVYIDEKFAEDELDGTDEGDSSADDVFGDIDKGSSAPRGGGSVERESSASTAEAEVEETPEETAARMPPLPE